MKKFQAIVMIPTETITEANTLEEAAQRIEKLVEGIKKAQPVNPNYDPIKAYTLCIHEVKDYGDPQPAGGKKPDQLPAKRRHVSTALPDVWFRSDPGDDGPGPLVAELHRAQ